MSHVRREIEDRLLLCEVELLDSHLEIVVELGLYIYLVIEHIDSVLDWVLKVFRIKHRF